MYPSLSISKRAGALDGVDRRMRSSAYSTWLRRVLWTVILSGEALSALDIEEAYRVYSSDPILEPWGTPTLVVNWLSDEFMGCWYIQVVGSNLAKTFHRGVMDLIFSMRRGWSTLSKALEVSTRIPVSDLCVLKAQ